MSFASIVGAWATWSRLTGNNDDDWVDRLNHIYTVIILVVFAIFIAGGQNLGDPISCWDEGFSPMKAKYMTSYCWVMNTYYIPMDTIIHKDTELRLDNEITYYQYVPLILLAMALLFKIPNVVWRSLSSFCGIHLDKVVEMTSSAHYMEGKKRAEKVADIASCIDRWLEANRQYHYNLFVRVKRKLAKYCCCFLNRREGTYLLGLYLLVKILYFVNVVSQFFILDATMGGFFGTWGFEAMGTLATEYRMKESIRFPRVTLCDFRIRQQTNIHRYTVQCVLPWNLFNEKIFLVIWFWFVLVAVITGVNILSWFWHSVIRPSGFTIIKKYLKLSSKLQTELDKKICLKFATFLRADGILLIRMIQKNSNDILATDVVCKLWEIYLEKPMIKRMFATVDGTGNSHYM